MRGGCNAQRNTDKNGDGDGPQGQLQAGGKTFGEVVGNGLVGVPCGSQITVQQSLDVVYKLNRVRIIQAPFLCQLIYLLLRGHFTQIHTGGVAGHNTGQKENYHDDQQNGGNCV